MSDEPKPSAAPTRANPGCDRLTLPFGRAWTLYCWGHIHCSLDLKPVEGFKPMPNDAPKETAK